MAPASEASRSWELRRAAINAWGSLSTTAPFRPEGTGERAKAASPSLRSPPAARGRTLGLDHEDRFRRAGVRRLGNSAVPGPVRRPGRNGWLRVFVDVSAAAGAGGLGAGAGVPPRARPD